MQKAEKGINTAYNRNTVEQVVGTTALNMSYQALLNAIKARPDKFPESVKKLVLQYPAYGTKQQFIDRNQMLSQHPEITLKYISDDGIRHIQGMADRWLQKQQAERRLKELKKEKLKRPELQKELEDDLADQNAAIERYNEMYFTKNKGQQNGTFIG